MLSADSRKLSIVSFFPPAPLPQQRNVFLIESPYGVLFSPPKFGLSIGGVVGVRNGVGSVGVSVGVGVGRRKGVGVSVAVGVGVGVGVSVGVGIT